MKPVDKARASFQSDRNCSQAVFEAFAEANGLDTLKALQISSGFGGGMKRADTCGVVTGALMALGLLYGPRSIESNGDKTQVNDKIAQFYDRFTAEHGAVMCRDLLGCDTSTEEGRAYALENNLFETRCTKFVESAAKIVDEL